MSVSRYRACVACVLLAIGLVAQAAPAQAPTTIADTAFARLIAALSEPNGFFDTDNLISNEDAYLRPVSTLRRLGIRGGAYVGVGPDQNFSYIAAIRPRVAFIVDIRRDNLLEHLLFKSIFALSRSRIDYLCLLFGEDVPADTSGWGARDITALLRHVDSIRARRRGTPSASLERVLARVRAGAVSLSITDLTTIARFHQAFAASGPSLQFNSFNRRPQPYYPDLRRLLLERDREGREGNFLAHEGDFQYVKSLEDRNLVIPVVGDFAGTHALPGVAEWLGARHEPVSAFYTSNVEQYLLRDGGFSQYVKTVARLPSTDRTVFIRSYFPGMPHPQAEQGYHVTQVLQYMKSFPRPGDASVVTSYFDLVVAATIPPI